MQKQTPDVYVKITEKLFAEGKRQPFGIYDVMDATLEYAKNGIKKYLAFIHTPEGLQYAGYFDNKDRIEFLCHRYNELHKKDNLYADYINITGELNDTFAFVGLDDEISQ